MDGLQRYLRGILHSSSSNWPLLFSWLSFAMWFILAVLVTNDYINLEAVQITEYTTFKISTIVYFLHLVGFWMAFIALVATNETVYMERYTIRLAGLVCSHALIFLLRVLCELQYIEYRPEVYRNVDDADFIQPYCASAIPEHVDTVASHEHF